MNTATDDPDAFRIPFRIHPRVFAALGADLVTDDVVAVIEIVKNSYDAVADNVWVRFRKTQSGKSYLEIEDDGQGMTRDIVENVWCVVATPYKESNLFGTRGAKKRRVVGEKGLGRLSAARLGQRLQMVTRAVGDTSWEINVEWGVLASGSDIGSSFALCTPYTHDFRSSGTRIRIYDLNGDWDDGKMADLKENLSRLISPFADTGDFRIHFADFAQSDDEKVDEIAAPEFLSNPVYAVVGNADARGNVAATYNFRPINGKPGRERDFQLSWEQILDGLKEDARAPYQRDATAARCGPFSFDLRVWDIDVDARQQLADQYDIAKNLIRRAIRAHKGISVYRDGVLVLPKSDKARDWLGLDLRRVSRVGTRVSTSQIVGYVAITADANSKIEDTSDRERLVSRIEVSEFEEVLNAVIGRLEVERDQDRRPAAQAGPTTESLFDDLSPSDLETRAKALAAEGASAREIVSEIRDYVRAFDAGRAKITERLIYYSRLATIGTIAEMLIHEIRNRTTAFGSFLDTIKGRFGPLPDDVAKKYQHAERAINALERLADTYAPLANRNYKRGAKTAIVEQCIAECVSMLENEIKKKNIRCKVSESHTVVAIHPGELQTVILNLLTNALYWLGQQPRDARDLQFAVDPEPAQRRVRVSVADTGPGIDPADLEKVFLPGITRKPGGIGMGLTVASEIIAGHGGRMGLAAPNKRGGARFEFDLPAA